MPDQRKTPEEFLAQLKEEKKESGKLKIFFGYAPGVGKTYAMLQAAHEAKKQGVDVVVGYIEPHTRPHTMALLDGLELLPPLTTEYRGIKLHEFDLDGALKRKPQLILVDEFAHTNADTCRHKKRYQDIDELLRMGIDVCTTVNVQHIESLNDIVASITGVTVRERIPDPVFDRASQVELVDIEPSELITRMNEGKVYKEKQAQDALDNFFSLENLTALREIALRRTADHVNMIAAREKALTAPNLQTDEHILVCLSSSPSNPKIIRTAARMALAFKGRFTALFVETPDFSEISDSDRARLRDSVHLAEQLGARIETAYGEDVPYQISEFARLNGVTDIVVGRSNEKKRLLISRQTFTERLTVLTPNLDVHVIPDENTNKYKTRWQHYIMREKFIPSDILKMLGVLLIATLVCFLFQRLGLNEANIITVYILSALVTSVVTSGRAFSLIGSLLSVLVFNFFFTEPRYSFEAYGMGYPVTFAVMFASALISSNLANRIKLQARQSALAASRTRTMLEMAQLLERSSDWEDIYRITGRQLVNLLNRRLVVYKADGDILDEPEVYAPEGMSLSGEELISPNERAVALWTFKNKKQAGATTSTLCGARCKYLAIRSLNGVYGVIGVELGKDSLEPFENSLTLSILGECTLALEKEMLVRKERAAAIQAQNEQLRANLLRSISHDLRTPLTGISGSANVLLQNELAPEKRKQLCQDIFDEAQWLIALVENLLSITRLEDGSMKINMEPELIDEVITEALKHVNRLSSEHVISFRRSDEMLLANMDAGLIMQVIINIVNNAIKYTQKGSAIVVSAEKKNEMVEVKIADDGPGVPDSEKEKLFDMFYTASSASSDSRRGLGLGLALCKSIISAHGGTISASDNSPKGAVFRFTLPAKEVKIGE